MEETVQDGLWKAVPGGAQESLQGLLCYLRCEWGFNQACLLGKGSEAGMQLGPILFALYVADMSKDLHESGLGVKLHRFTKRFLSYVDGSSAFLMEVYLA